MTLYTPPGYDTSLTRYPVLYLLHGYGGDELTYDDLQNANLMRVIRGNCSTKPLRDDHARRFAFLRQNARSP